MDLPLITKATSDYYRNIYADPLLGPIFRGVNMVVLRQHVSYFIHQVTTFDMPMTQRQLEYLRKVHGPVIERHNVSQTHYDLMVGHLMEAMRRNGAQEHHLSMVQAKLQPLRDLFPPPNTTTDTLADSTVMLSCPQQQQRQHHHHHHQSLQPGQVMQQQAGSLGQASSICTDDDSCEQQQQEEQPSDAGQLKFKAWARKVLKGLRGKN